MKSILSLACLFLLNLTVHAQQDTIDAGKGVLVVPLKKGKGDQPQNGDKVKVHYKGFLAESGKPFDSSYDRGPFKFKLGKKQVIPGWEQGLKKMKEGGKATVIIPPEMGYGEKGVPKRGEQGEYVIPPGARLRFTIELIKVR